MEVLINRSARFGTAAWLLVGLSLVLMGNDNVLFGIKLHPDAHIAALLIAIVSQLACIHLFNHYRYHSKSNSIQE